MRSLNNASPDHTGNGNADEISRNLVERENETQNRSPMESFNNVSRDSIGNDDDNSRSIVERDEEPQGSFQLG